MKKKLFLKFFSPDFFLKFADRIVVVLIFPCLIFIFYGTVYGLFFVPSDFQQKDAFRIIYVHVPSAYMSILIYVFIGMMSIIYILSNMELFDFIAYSSAKIGSIFTLIALITGSIWGKPMWGTWWIWDARLTSELILLFLYFGYLGLRNALANRHIASNSCAVLSLIGLINVPIIHYSVEWWYTLHQRSTLSRLGKPSIDLEMLYPLISMCVGFFLFYFLILIMSVKNEILLKKSEKMLL
ncbi:MAG TPA: heme ABC transporter permease [Candidatus Azoamicus sp. OHIO1]